MAPSSKRKRTAPSNSQHKRLKYSESSSPAQPIDSQEDYWLAECICDEKVDRGTRKYLVQWQGRDPATGKAWAPTWEPRAHCSKPLLASWEIEKTIKEREHRRGKGGQSHKKARASTLPSKSRSTALGSEPTTPAHDSAVLHGSASSSSATIQAETAASPFTPHASPRIPIKQRGSSFDAAEYEPYSESASSQSQSQSAQSHTQQTDLASSQLFAESARPKPLSSGIVQDSQDSAGEATFLPTTQHHSSQSSTTATTESPEEQVEDDVTEDSGLLDITENLLSRHPSRARSIAETIPETVADSQSQLPQFITPEIAETPSVTQTPTELSDIVLRQVSNRYGSSNIEEQTRLPSQQGPAHGFIQVLETPPEYEQLYPPRVQRFRRVREEIPLTSSQVCPASPQPAIGHIPATSNEKSLSEDTTQFQSAPQVPLHIQAVISALSARTHPASQHTCTETRVSSTIPPRQDFTSRTAKRQHHRPEHTTFSGVSRVSDQQEIGPVIPEASSRRVADSLLGRASACESQQFRSSRESIRSQEQCAQIVPSDFGLDTPAENTPSIQEPVDPEQKKRDLDSFRAEHPHLVFPAGNLSTQEETPPTILETVEQVYGSGEQCAQIVPRGAELSTQEHATSSTRGTEGQKHRKRGISKSRHDSSQESPKPTGSSGHTSSPIRYPPNYSLPSGASSLPPRPATPATISLRSIMSSDKIVSVHVASELGTEIDMHCTQKPFTPSRRVIGRGSNANLANNSEDSPAASGSARRLLGANASPLLAHPGTRSPSAIPDHAPESIAPKSLCAVVTVPPPPPPPPLVTDKTVIEKPTQNTVFEKPTRHTVFEKPKPKEVTELPTTGANIQVLETQEERETPPESAQAATEPNNNDELSDADDEENGSLVHDDLQLEDEEHIVPIYIEGRQLDMYRAYVKQHQTVLEQFLVDRQNFKELSKVKEILAHLRGIETHIDLVFAEADSSSFENTATQIGHAARFGRENSVKFRFLQSFFHSLREHKKHVLLVTEHDDEAFFRIIETFCKAEYINYNMPTYGRQADPSAVEGAMSVTIIPSTTSPIVNPPDVIICLDGVQTASRIRLRNWAQARSPIHQVVPVLHLVIPQTVSAIERFIAPSLSHRDQLHATIAILAQMYRSGTLGKPVDGGPVPRASSYGPVVVDWMIESHGGSAWLLPALDRIKDVTEYQSQISPEIQASTTPPAIGRYKRRLVSELCVGK